MVMENLNFRTEIEFLTKYIFGRARQDESNGGSLSDFSLKEGISGDGCRDLLLMNYFSLFIL